MLVTAAGSLCGLGGFRQVHAAVPPTTGPCCLRLALRQSLCYKRKGDTNEKGEKCKSNFFCLIASTSFSISSRFIAHDCITCERDSPMAMKISFTFMDVLADVSINSRLLSSAYDWASCRGQGMSDCSEAHSRTREVALTWKSTALLLARSALLPDRAMTILGLACRCSSFTQFFARANDSYRGRTARSVLRSYETRRFKRWRRGPRYLVCDVVDHDGGLRPSVIHGRQTVVALLAGGVPDFKLHRCVV